MKKLLFVLTLASLALFSLSLQAESPDDATLVPSVVVDQWFAQFELPGIEMSAHSLPNCFTYNGTACYSEGATQRCVYGPCEFGMCFCNGGTWTCYT